MKRKLSGIMVAAAVFTGSMVTPIALDNVKAATNQQKQSVLKEKVIVNGKVTDVEYKVLNHTKLYSATSLAKIMSASIIHKPNSFTYTFTKGSGTAKKTLEINVASTKAVLNGKKVSLSKAPRLVDNTLYVEPTYFVKTFGGNVQTDRNLVISTNSGISFGTEKLNVDGQTGTIKTILLGGKTWYSTADFAKLTASSIKVDKSNQYYISRNGKSSKIGQTPFTVKGVLYTDLNELVKALGGDLLSQPSGKFLSIAGLISGDAYNLQWMNDSSLLISNSVDSSSNVVNVKEKKAALKINGTDAVVSPDGKKAVYSDENGVVYVEDLVTKKVTTLNNANTDPKFDFNWSNDGMKVYFITGGKMDGIASINISDGTITPIPSNTNSGKSDLSLSPDGNKLIFTAGKEGTTNYTDGNQTDVSGIDLTNTENQIYVVDMNATEVKAVQLTTSTDNKAFSAFLPNGNIVFTGFDINGVKLPTLKMIDTNNNNALSTLIDNQDVVTSTVTAQGKLIIVVNEPNGYQTINLIDPATKKLTKLAQTKMEITSVSISADGKMMAITVPGDHGDRVFVLNNGQFEELTK